MLLGCKTYVLSAMKETAPVMTTGPSILTRMASSDRTSIPSMYQTRRSAGTWWHCIGVRIAVTLQPSSKSALGASGAGSNSLSFLVSIYALIAVLLTDTAMLCARRHTGQSINGRAKLRKVPMTRETIRRRRLRVLVQRMENQHHFLLPQRHTVLPLGTHSFLAQTSTHWTNVVTSNYFCNMHSVCGIAASSGHH